MKLDDIHSAEATLGEFHHWTEAEQGLILGSFFWGYVITQLPGGILSDKYGGKWPLGLGLFITAIFAILSPICARTHTYLLMFCRVMQGLGEVRSYVDSNFSVILSCATNNNEFFRD